VTGAEREIVMISNELRALAEDRLKHTEEAIAAFPVANYSEGSKSAEYIKLLHSQKEYWLKFLSS
jgi:hypothetical protein